MLLNIHVDPTSPTKSFLSKLAFRQNPKHNEKVLRSRDVFGWTEKERTENILFIARSLRCLGHPRWRMFKFQLNRSGFYMLHEHHIYPKIMLNPSEADCWLIRFIHGEVFIILSSGFISNNSFTFSTRCCYSWEASDPEIVIIINCSFSWEDFSSFLLRLHAQRWRSPLHSILLLSIYPDGQLKHNISSE